MSLIALNACDFQNFLVSFARLLHYAKLLAHDVSLRANACIFLQLPVVFVSEKGSWSNVSYQRQASLNSFDVSTSQCFGIFETSSVAFNSLCQLPIGTSLLQVGV